MALTSPQVVRSHGGTLEGMSDPRLQLIGKIQGNLTLDDSDLLVQAAAERGIAYVPEYFAQPFLGSGQLVTVLGDWCPPTPGLALYYPRSRHVPSPLRAFIDLLIKWTGHYDEAPAKIVSQGVL